MSGETALHMSVTIDTQDGVIGDTATLIANDPALVQWMHCELTENLAQNYTPNTFEKRKILLPEYPMLQALPAA